jgi:alanyl-tRNA synthetase
MTQQRQRSRGAVRDRWQDVQDLPASEFVGYDQLETETRLAALRLADQPAATAAEGDEVEVYLERTPFYAEAGGQVGDTGRIVGPAGSVRIDDTLKRTEGVIVHLGTVVTGSLSVGETVRAAVDASRRHQVARHHSATHLLHQALCEVLGVDNAQRGSWVGPDHTTFDFPLNRPLTDEELKRVGSRIREKVREALPLHVREMERRQAEASGAKHLFEEKYGERVRVVCIGDWTCELCGGTHVATSADVGTTLILSEASIGSGLRRIDLAAGDAADHVLERRLHALDDVARDLGVRPEEAPLRVGELRTELKEAHREIEGLKADLMRARLPVADDGAPLIDHRVEEAWVDLKDFADEVLGRRQQPAVAFISRGQQYVLKVSGSLVDRYDATELRRLVGPGGGRPDLVSGKLDKTHEEAAALLRQKVQ